MIKDYKPIPYYMIPKFQRGGIWNPVMYGKLADQSNNLNLLVQPESRGYKEGLDFQRLYQGYNQQNLQQENLDFRREQADIMNEFRNKQLALREDQFDFERALAIDKYGRDYIDPMLNVDINPGDQEAMNMLGSSYAIDDPNIDLNTLDGQRERYKRVQQMVRSGEFKALVENNALANAISDKLKSFDEASQKVANDIRQSPYYDTKRNEYSALVRELANARTQENYDMKGLLERANALQISLNETGQGQVALAQETAQIGLEGAKIKNQVEQAKIDKYQAEIDLINAREDLTDAQKAAKIAEIGEGGTKPASVKDQIALQEAQDKRRIIHALVTEGQEQGLSAGEAYNRAVQMYEGKFKPEDAAAGTGYRNLFFNSKGKIDEGKSTVSFDSIGEVNVPISNLKKVAQRYGEVPDLEGWIGNSTNAGDDTIIEYEAGGGDGLGYIVTNSPQVYMDVMGITVEEMGDFDELDLVRIDEDGTKGIKIPLSKLGVGGTSGDNINQSNTIIIPNNVDPERPIMGNPSDTRLYNNPGTSPHMYKAVMEAHPIFYPDENNTTLVMNRVKPLAEHSEVYKTNNWSLEKGWSGTPDLSTDDPNYVAPLNPRMKSLAVALVKQYGEGVKFTSFSRSQAETEHLANLTGEVANSGGHLEGKGIDVTGAAMNRLWSDITKGKKVPGTSNTYYYMYENAGVQYVYTAHRHAGTSDHIDFKLQQRY